MNRLAAILFAACLAVSAKAQSPLDASVVLRTVENGSTSGVGSGTVIDAQPGKCLIVTAGHLFRDCAGRCGIRVSFHDGTTADGWLQTWQSNPDIALVQVLVNPPAVATIAKYDPQLNEATTRIGMFGVYQGSVRSLNRYDGPANIEINGASIEADSGGGIFNRSGELIGVTVATDTQETIGTGLRAVHAEVGRLGIKEVGCRWVRDQYGNCVRVCDNAPPQMVMPPAVVQPQLPPLRPPVSQQPPAQQPATRPPVTGTAGPAGIAGPQGPAGPKGDKGDKGESGAPGKDADVNVIVEAVWAKVEQRINENNHNEQTINAIVAEVTKKLPPTTVNYLDGNGNAASSVTVPVGGKLDIPPVRASITLLDGTQKSQAVPLDQPLKFIQHSKGVK